MRGIVHDGNGTWFEPTALVVSSLNDQEVADLRAGDEAVLQGDDVVWDRLAGYSTGDSLLALMRVLTLWLPHAELDEAEDGTLTIHTGLRIDGSTLRMATDAS